MTEYIVTSRQDAVARNGSAYVNLKIASVEDEQTMDIYDVQVTTDMDETIVLQVTASSPQEAEMTAINMVETGEAGTYGMIVVDCFAL